MSFFSLWIWSARDILRRPFESLLIGLALFCLVFIVSVPSLFYTGLKHHLERVYQNSPNLILRRVDAAGWQAMPEDALAKVRAIRGITKAKLRIWGMAQLKDPQLKRKRRVVTIWADATIKKGHAKVGDLFKNFVSNTIDLVAQKHLRVIVDDVVGEAFSMTSHDLIFLSPEDARLLLGIKGGSDIALWVYHENEANVLAPELSNILGFPIRIETRQDSEKSLMARLGKKASLRLELLFPALIGFLLFIVAIVRTQLGSRSDHALLRALGWDGKTVIRFVLFRALVIALPALSLGWFFSYAAVAWGWFGFGPHFFDIDYHFALSLDAFDVILSWLFLGGLILVPYIVACLLPSFSQINNEPHLGLKG